MNCLCSQPGYASHLAPIWHALPEGVRGHWYATGLCADLGNVEGVPGWRRVGGLDPADLTMVGGWLDEMLVPGRAIYVEHGSGQTYGGDPDNRVVAEHESYSGSPGHDRVALFLCPSETVAARWRVRYPGTPAAVVGCPKLDWWHAHRGEMRPGAVSRPTLAVTFHADNRLCPETVGAWRHYEGGLSQAVRRLQTFGWQVLGHGHPRLWQPLRTFWSAIGVEPVADFGEVLARADVLALDNSSVGPEFASTGRPLVWMDAPWYRRDVHHGGRFWEWPEGQVVIDSAEELPGAAERALACQPEEEEARVRMVRAVYVACDGRATERAVQAITAAVKEAA